MSLYHMVSSSSLVSQGERFVIPRDATFSSIVVPTMDTVRNEFLINSLIIHGHHVLCTGDTGTGKSVTVKKKLLFGMGLKFRSIMLNFSAQTSANQVGGAGDHSNTSPDPPSVEPFLTVHNFRALCGLWHVPRCLWYVVANCGLRVITSP